MPSRKDIFANGQVYHIYNKAIKPFRPFYDDGLKSHFLDLLRYYRSSKPNLSYSHYIDMPDEERKLYDRYLDSKRGSEILAFCIMPNHYHLLIKQICDDGLLKLVSNTINSFTRYVNKRAKRSGPLFLPQFRSKRIISIEQLLHVSRYIHLNPMTAEYIKNVEELINYPYCSMNEYVSSSFLCNTKIIMHYFYDKVESYVSFVAKNVEYQKFIETIKNREKRKTGFK